MVSLRVEFHNQLTKITATSAAVYTDVTGSTTNTSITGHDLQEAAETTASNSDAINALWEIAERMRADGQVSECIQVYKTVRKAFLRTSLQLFGIEKQSVDDIRGLLSIELEELTNRFIRACNVSCSILFPAEMNLCLRIFKGEERSVCYSGTIEDTIAQLTAYASSLISVRRFPKLLFNYLDLHEALLNLWTKRKEDSVKHIIDELVEKIRCSLSEFQESLLHELSTEITRLDGEVSSLIREVMYHRTRIARYKDSLTDLIVSKPGSIPDMEIPDMEYAKVAGRTPIELHTIYVAVLLRFKIESRSKYYYKADSTESYLFLTNNLAHMVQCITQSHNLEDMIGISYLNKLRNNYLTEVMTKYQRKVTDDMLQCLKNETALGYFPMVWPRTPTNFHRRIASFYAMFEAARFNQSRWAGPAGVLVS